MGEFLSGQEKTEMCMFVGQKVQSPICWFQKKNKKQLLTPDSSSSLLLSLNCDTNLLSFSSETEGSKGKNEKRIPSPARMRGIWSGGKKKHYREL